VIRSDMYTELNETTFADFQLWIEALSRERIAVYSLNACA